MKARWILPPVFVVLVALVAFPVAQANNDDDDGENDDELELTVVERAETDTLVDLPPLDDPSLGDIIAFGNPIFDADNDNEIGRDQGYCIRTNLDSFNSVGSFECTLEVILDDGSIVVQGPLFDDGRDAQWAVTGGTGDFRGVRGEMTLRLRDEDDRADPNVIEFDFIFDLILDDLIVDDDDDE